MFLTNQTRRTQTANLNSDMFLTNHTAHTQTATPNPNSYMFLTKCTARTDQLHILDQSKRTQRPVTYSRLIRTHAQTSCIFSTNQNAHTDRLHILDQSEHMHRPAVCGSHGARTIKGTRVASSNSVCLSHLVAVHGCR